MNARIPTVTPAVEERELAVSGLIPLNEHTIMILGRADFACMRVAQRLRELGHKINRNAQEEQAAVIHLNLTMYQQHGAAWFEHANAYLEQGRAVESEVVA